MTVELMRRSLLELPLLAVIAVGAHLVMSGGQTLLHYSLGHRRLGGTFFRNHIRFHHTIYARGHLVSAQLSRRRRKQHAMLSDPDHTRCSSDVSYSPTRFLSRGGRCERNVVLCVRLF